VIDEQADGLADRQMDGRAIAYSALMLSRAKKSLNVTVQKTD